MTPLPIFSTAAEYQAWVDSQKADAIAQVGDAKINFGGEKISEYRGDERYAGYLNPDGRTYSYQGMPGDRAEVLVSTAKNFMAPMVDTSDLHD